MTPAAATAATTAGATVPAARPHLRAVTPAPADFVTRAAAAGVVVDGPLQHGALLVDLPSYVVTLDGEPLELSARQVELLALFLAAPRKVWSRDQLHWLCWGDTTPSRRVDVQLCRLRGRTGLDLFRNVRDRGWALRPSA
jgi:DNA-binding response OmpR family regulator